ncbi:uncharacterized protein LOC126721288 [Quercus robur]|uniref:uncharacterized protein LOC126721288 n=1 Tax=Quercus robur TaxID=38942 RepID=UPI00216120E0|nr:uncharacterized protein LOC126721288 [Quercus robur]
MANDFEVGSSHINSNVTTVTERIEGVENIVEQNQGDAYREQGVERTEAVENINGQNHGDGYREQGGEEAGHLSGREILVQTFGGNLINVRDTAGYYDPLQYPILFPFGTYGWDINTRDTNRNKVSCRDYYAFIFQIRDNALSMIWYGGRLSQQYVVDNYVKIETHKLRWFEHNQDSIRAYLYQGLQDAFHEGESDTGNGNVGHRTILPSSFVGSPGDMIRRFQDAMSLVQKFRKLDLFIIMTCNPGWEEIQNELLPTQTAQDRPYLLARVFKLKFEELKDDIVVKGVLGRVIVYVQVFEFQKRGLPHVHMLIILDEDEKLHNLEDYDRVVKAEILCKEEQPQLHKAVLKHMIHGPCGVQNPRSPCMKNGRCKKGYPKPFSLETYQGNDSYPVYKRYDTNNPVPLNDHCRIMVDNTWVVPYNPWLLLKYNCHINVEICCSIKSVKYLYKYVYKGPDRVSMEVRPGPNYDEVQ